MMSRIIYNICDMKGGGIVDNGYTQKQIAEMLGVSQNTYSQYEIGVLNYPVDVIIKLADFYGTTTDYLLGRTDIK